MTSWSSLTDYPPNHPEIRSDMDKRYQHTYLTMVDVNTKKIIPVWYQGSTRTSYVFTKQNGDVMELPLTDQTVVDVLLPKVGYYNIKGNPFYLIKNPQRQWKRSLCTSIYQILSPINKQNIPAERLPTSWWFLLAQESLSPKYANLDDIKKEIFGNIALNNKFAVATDINNVPSLIYKRYKIAELDFNSRSVIVTQPLLLQEIQDLFKYTGVTTWNLHPTRAE